MQLRTQGIPKPLQYPSSQLLVSNIRHWDTATVGDGHHQIGSIRGFVQQENGVQQRQGHREAALFAHGTVHQFNHPIDFGSSAVM